jgi:hypothetical protein
MRMVGSVQLMSLTVMFREQGMVILVQDQYKQYFGVRNRNTQGGILTLKVDEEEGMGARLETKESTISVQLFIS